MSRPTLSAVDLAEIPAAQPPPGILPNFVDPESCGNAVITGLAISSALMCFFVILRVYTRISITRSLGWDDYTSIGATIGSLAYFGLLAYAFTHGLGIHRWNISALKLLSMTQTLQAINYLYGPFMFLAKLSLCLLFFRLFSPSLQMRFLIYFAIAYNIILHLGGLLLAIFLCFPGNGNENFFKCSYKITTLDIVISGMNIFSDFYLLGLPIIAVSGLQMAMRKKLGIIAVFLTGFLACVSSILGEIYRLQRLHLARSPDITWNLSPVLVLAVLEIEIAVIVGCLPVLPAFFRQQKRFSLRLSSLSSLRNGLFRSRGASGSKHRRSSFSVGSLPAKPQGTPESELKYIQIGEGYKHGEAV